MYSPFRCELFPALRRASVTDWLRVNSSRILETTGTQLDSFECTCKFATKPTRSIEHACAGQSFDHVALMSLAVRRRGLSSDSGSPGSIVQMDIADRNRLSSPRSARFHAFPIHLNHAFSRHGKCSTRKNSYALRPESYKVRFAEQ